MTVPRVEAVAQAGDHAHEAHKPAFDFRKPFFNSDTAAAYVDSPSLAAFRRWAARHGVHAGHRGRRLVYARVDLDRALGFAHRQKVSA